MSEPQWDTVREGYSEDGDAWNYFTPDHARRESFAPGSEPAVRLVPGTPSYTSVAEPVPSHISRP